MPIRVYNYQHDIENLEVHPEIRARFLRMEPGPAGGLHSHDLGGEIFLVLEGHCEFLVEDERVTCGPGQLIYVEPRRMHTLHAVGAVPCVVYLSVTPHVEPTHTFYDGAGAELPPRYGSWRGQGDAAPSPDAATTEVTSRYASEVRRLAALAQANAETLDLQVEALAEATAAGDARVAKQSMDGMWLGLRAVLRCASATELAWNALAPRAMPAE